MQHGKAFNSFIQSLELDAPDGMFFHNIDSKIYVTNHQHRLLGIWDEVAGTVMEATA